MVFLFSIISINNIFNVSPYFGISKLNRTANEILSVISLIYTDCLHDMTWKYNAIYMNIKISDIYPNVYIYGGFLTLFFLPPLMIKRYWSWLYHRNSII